MPLIVDLPTAARLELGTSTSPACQRRWEEGIDVSLARLRIPRGQPGFDAYPFLAGVPSPLHPLNSTVLLVHIGKTGGSTVATTLHKAGIRNDAVHVHPVPRSLFRATPHIVVSIRDPVARFLSAFNWGVRLRQGWAMNFSECYDAEKFAVEFAYHRLNPALPPASRGCGRLQQAVQEWTKPAGWMDAQRYGHIRWDGCFYLGGCVADYAPISRRLFAVRTEALVDDVAALLRWLHASSQPPPVHLNDNSRSNTRLRPFASEVLEVALADEYRLANRVLQVISSCLERGEMTSCTSAVQLELTSYLLLGCRFLSTRPPPPTVRLSPAFRGCVEPGSWRLGSKWPPTFLKPSCACKHVSKRM